MNCKQSGCKAPALRDDDYCFWHSPTTAKKRREAGRRGGKKGRLQVRNVDIQSVEDVRHILSETLSELRSSPAESVTTKARAIGYLCSICLVALEKGDLEERLGKLEELMSESEKIA